MNALIGWSLAVAATAMAWHFQGWPGVLIAVSAIVFWLLLQFSRAMQAMKNAAQAPKGRIDSAVMFNARLKAGMTMMQVITLSRSLGERVSESPETWAWTDGGNSQVTMVFEAAKLARWQLQRPDAPTP